MKNYYSILGVTPDSNLAEIKSAFRNLARKYHPDVNPEGVNHFKDISEAYEILSDEKKRLQYDTLNGFFKSAPKQHTFSKQAQSEYEKNSKRNDKDDISKKINDIFEEFTKTKPKKEKKLPRRGADIFEEISITIKEAVIGVEKTVNVMHSTGCPHCKGRKFINGSMCPVCKGSGEQNEHKKITVKIPRNIKNGAKLRIPHEGGSGENGGKNGDLFLKIKIESNSRISIEENNIIYNIPITPFEAVLGANISVPVFEGSISLKIPPKTHSGQKFRLAGQGLHGNGKNGDMIVIVHIEIPCSLSDDEIRLYEKLKKLSAQNIRENLLNE